MSLDIYLNAIRPTCVYSSNITHNLGEMADKAGIYEYLWRPDELGINRANELIAPLQEGLKNLKEKPDYFKQFNANNGWGVYENLVGFVEEYLANCIENPDAEVEVSR